MTKKQFAKWIIINNSTYNRKEKFTKDSLKKLVPEIYTSSSLGVALEYLGVITKEEFPKEYEYVQSRGGIYLTFMDNETEKLATLSVREVLDLLPE